MIRAAASAVSCTSATAKGSLRDANSKTIGANSAYWAGVALVANETIFAGSCPKRSSISSESLFPPLVRQMPIVFDEGALGLSFALPPRQRSRPPIRPRRYAGH
jgi:hypothetical protein